MLSHSELMNVEEANQISLINEVGNIMFLF